jgi:nitroimidazol reductase NimA-like FMN-containing flavoprotein (pyridoxamine 5'-phosphate oxidase superfamily)
MRTSGAFAAPGQTTVAEAMDINELDPAACRSVIAGNRLGRVVYTYRAMPAAAPVHYLSLGDRMLLTVPPNSELITELTGQVIALLVEDDHEYMRRSVLLIGLCRELSAASEGLESEPVYFELDSPVVRGRRTRLR